MLFLLVLLLDQAKEDKNRIVTVSKILQSIVIVQATTFEMVKDSKDVIFVLQQ